MQALVHSTSLLFYFDFFFLFYFTLIFIFSEKYRTKNQSDILQLILQHA